MGRNLNIYDLSGEHGIGYTAKGEEFYFDLEDYDLIKNYSWHKNDNKYKYIANKTNNKKIFMHRLIMNCPEYMHIDHIHHIGYDNRKNNLRIVNISQNHMNTKLQSNNISGYTGISWSNKYNKWRAYINIDIKKQLHLGYFNNLEDAIKIRQEAEIKYFGEYRYCKGE